MTLPEGDLTAADSNPDAHVIIHTELNRLGLSSSIAGDALEVSAIAGPPNILGLAAPFATKASNIQTITHDTSGSLDITLVGTEKAIVVNASAPITGASLIGAATHGEIAQVPMLLKAIGGSISVDLTGITVYGVDVPGTLNAGDEFPTLISELDLP